MDNMNMQQPMRPQGPTKQCKYCKTAIPKKASVCPQCGRKQRGLLSYIGIAIVALIILGGIAGVANKDKKPKIDNSKSTNAATEAASAGSKEADASKATTAATEAATEVPAPVDAVVKPGGSFDYETLHVTYDSVNTDYVVEDDPYGLHTPKEGNKLISASFTFTNNGDKDKYVDIYSFDCYADNKSCEQTYITSVDDFINANISSGRSVTFSVFYEVPKDAKSIELEYSGMLSSEKVLIEVQ